MRPDLVFTGCVGITSAFTVKVTVFAWFRVATVDDDVGVCGRLGDEGVEMRRW